MRKRKRRAQVGGGDPFALDSRNRQPDHGDRACWGGREEEDATKGDNGTPGRGSMAPPKIGRGPATDDPVSSQSTGTRLLGSPADAGNPGTAKPTQAESCKNSSAATFGSRGLRFTWVQEIRRFPSPGLSSCSFHDKHRIFNTRDETGTVCFFLRDKSNRPILPRFMSRYTRGLNPEQHKAVRTVKGPLLVLAGAGTGKTRVITHRIAHLVDQGVKPGSILAMTFTNKAAGEMKQRVSSLLKNGASRDLTVGTFHSFCVKALRRYPDRAGIRPGFGICDADDQLVAMKQALRELQIPESSLNPRLCLSQVSLLKNRLTSPDALLESRDDFEASLGRAYQRYNAGLRVSGVLDFDDLLLYMVRLLQDGKTLASFRRRNAASAPSSSRSCSKRCRTSDTSSSR